MKRAQLERARPPLNLTQFHIAIRAADDWFTLAPRYRKKHKLLEHIVDAIRDSMEAKA